LRIYSYIVKLVLLSLSVYALSFAQSEKIISISENFDTDPGWENYNNRVECTNCPTVEQNFGWAPTNNNGDGVGEIGGTIYRSTTSAYYGMPIGKPLNFKECFSASGKISVIAPEKEGFGFYLGFFNAERQGWRVWSSCGARVGKMYYNIDGYEKGVAKWHLDYKTGAASGAILNTDFIVPGDGSVHSWEMKYEPDVSVADYDWPDKRLVKYFPPSGRNIHTDSILVAFQKDDPTMTKEKLLELLFDARDKGLVDDWYRKGKYHLWNKEQEPEKIKGKISFTWDGETASYFLIPGHQELPTTIDRFGFWNMQIYTGSVKFYVSDLIINNHKMDLSQDPHWQGLNNRVNYIEKDFHEGQNYGYSQTNWAGENPGEVGGRVYGTEVIDPIQGYYATDIGQLTLEDPIKFSGKVVFTEGAVDGRMLIGYFNKAEKLATVKGEYKGNPPDQYLGLEVMDKTKVGYNFTAVVSPRQDISTENRGPIFIPDRIQRPFSFEYNPDAGEAGRITVTLGEETFTTDLSLEQRKAGSTFDRFGLLNPRKGGKYVDVYFDDLTYSSRKPKSEVKWHRQKVIKVPYPEWGRKY